MAKAKCEHDCNVELMGIPEEDRGLLSGFTSRGFAALAHLREAWIVADGQNARAIEEAIRALMRGHSFADHPYWVAAVLAHRHERYELLDRVGVQRPVCYGTGGTSERGWKCRLLLGHDGECHPIAVAP